MDQRYQVFIVNCTFLYNYLSAFIKDMESLGVCS